MTREEQINQELKTRYETPHFNAGFVEGAHWADEHPHWISVKDELPKKYDSYLTCTSGNVIEITHYNIDGWHTESRGEVTHWQPLPAPPSSSEIPNNHKKGTVSKMETTHTIGTACPDCEVAQFPPCEKNVPCCKCSEQCNSRQPCPKKGNES